MTDDVKFFKNGVNLVLEAQGIIVPKGACLVVLQDALTGKIKSIEKIKNTFCDAGRKSIADHLRGTLTNNRGIITYCALGTNSTAPTAADTHLGTELFRKLVSVRSWDAAKVATFQTFFTTSEANGSLREAGLFGDDASSTPDTGTLFSKLAINRTKSSSDTLTLAWNVTIG